GGVFLVWHPTRYAELLGDLIDQHHAQVWLVNTGWSGGAFGVGKRMKLAHTRAMVQGALSGALDGVKTRTDPVFGLAVPQSVPHVPSEILDPRGTWGDSAAYDSQAKKLADMFRKNFEKFGGVATKIREAGPQG
ncbi:MAG: phosphoenolpyruvate carboxykinase (ATP), partial [Gemmatimonadaceae bacterium]